MCQCQTTSRRRTGRRRPRTRVHWAQQTRRERIRDWLAGNGITILVQEDETSNSEREQPILDLSPPPASSSLQVYLYNTILLHISRYPLLSMVVIEFYCCNRIIFSRRRTPAIYRPWRRIPCPPPPSPPSTSTSTLSSRINTKWRHMKFRCAQVVDVSQHEKVLSNFKKQFRYFKSN